MKDNKKSLSRREFLRLSVLGTAGLASVAYAPSTTSELPSIDELNFATKDLTLVDSDGGAGAESNLIEIEVGGRPAYIRVFDI